MWTTKELNRIRRGVAKQERVGLEMPPAPEIELSGNFEEFKNALRYRPGSLAVIFAPFYSFSSPENDEDRISFGQRMTADIKASDFQPNGSIAVHGLPREHSGYFDEFRMLASCVADHYQSLGLATSVDVEEHQYRHDETAYALSDAYMDLAAQNLWSQASIIAIVSYVGAKHILGYDSQPSDRLNQLGGVMIPAVTSMGDQLDLSWTIIQTAQAKN